MEVTVEDAIQSATLARGLRSFSAILARSGFGSTRNRRGNNDEHVSPMRVLARTVSPPRAPIARPTMPNMIYADRVEKVFINPLTAAAPAQAPHINLTTLFLE